MEKLLSIYRPLVTKEIISFFQNPNFSSPYYNPLKYHFGLIDKKGNNIAEPSLPGKLLRPILFLLTYQGLSYPEFDLLFEQSENFSLRQVPSGTGFRQVPFGTWLRSKNKKTRYDRQKSLEQVLPAAVAIELAHNFSIVHDDIEDEDEIRHGKETIWKVWGQAIGINSGDLLYSMSFKSFLQLKKNGFSEKQLFSAIQIFTTAIKHMILGQQMDINFEKRMDVTVPEYLEMIAGKTGAMITLPLILAAELGNATSQQKKQLSLLGSTLGYLFQIQDDFLGIWGKEKITGKSASSDIIKRKKTYPICWAINQKTTLVKKLKEIYINTTTLTTKDVSVIKKLLEKIGAKEQTEKIIDNYYNSVIDGIQKMNCNVTFKQNLLLIADFFAKRNS